LTGQISWTKRSWDKVRFSSKHRLWTKFSSKGDLGVIYNGQWGELFNTKWDGFIDLTLVNPDLINEFFGIGNTTSINEELREQDFFFARQNRYLFLFGLKRSFWKKSEISFGTGFGLYNSSPLDGSILSEAIDVTGSSGTLSTIPLLIDFTLDLRDNISYPTRGVQLKFLSHNYYQVASENNRFGLLGSSLDYHLSSRSKKKIILSLKAAGNLGYGLIPYYLQNRLGQNSGLRGFTGFRFTGSSMVYLNSELKVELIKNTSSAIPITLGVLGFYDRGRVFTPNESELNNNYHFGYGGGIYLIPFSRKFIFSLSFSWSEEQAFFPGFRFGSVF